MRRVAHILPAALATLLLAGVHPASAQSAADSAAIRATALDYIEGFFTGDATRMEHALHPHLAKRQVMTSPQGWSNLGDMTALDLIQATARGGGKNIPANQKKTDVTILDIFQNIAMAKIDAGVWMDYLQLVKWNGKWVIMNVVWDPRARGDGPAPAGREQP